MVMSNQLRRGAAIGDLATLMYQPGKRKPTRAQSAREILREMISFMQHPEKLAGTAIKRVDATCGKCEWPLNANQVETATCPTCGHLKENGIKFKAVMRE